MGPKYGWLLLPTQVFLISRGLTVLAGYLGNLAVPTSPGHWHPAPNNLWLDVWARWDAEHYVSIVTEGYQWIPGEQTNVAFFPLYPLLIRLLSEALGGEILSGIIISNVCFFLALVVVFRVIQSEWSDIALSRQSLYYLSLFPTALFFSAIYPTSLFLLISALTIYFARQRRWLLSGVFGSLSTATHFIGVACWLFLALEIASCFLQYRKAQPEKSVHRLLTEFARIHWTAGVALLALPVGLLFFMMHLEMTVGDGLAFFKAQSEWGKNLTIPFPVLITNNISTILTQNYTTGRIDALMTFDTMSLLLVLITSAFMFRWLPISYGAYCLISVLIPASTGTTLSMTRYIVVLFPVFMILARVASGITWDKVITTTFAVLLAIFTTAFVNWIFVG